jgi:hypothetical protein
VDADAGGTLGDVERGGDLGVRGVTEHPHLDRRALRLGQVVNGIAKSGVEAVEPMVFGGCDLGGSIEAEAPSGLLTHAVLTHGRRDHVACDPEEPRRGPLATVEEPASREPGLSERLGGELEGDGRIARSAQHERVHPRDVPVVERAERGGAPGGAAQ